MPHLPNHPPNLSATDTPEEIVSSLPSPNSYTRDFQPTYFDKQALVETVNELQHTVAVTTPAQIMAVRQQLGEIAAGQDSFVVIEGGCSEPVDIRVSIADLVGQALLRRQAVIQSNLGHRAVLIQRSRGQSVKPRSAELESPGLVSYMGDGVNGIAHADRMPDVSRMVAMAVQARDLEAGLQEAIGHHMPAAHEALLLPYERSFLTRDADTGRRYLLSADLPWIGMRTNATQSEHVRLLTGIENAVGVKIGATSTPAHIAELAQALNPEHQAGKLVLMLRVGKANETALRRVLQAIQQHAPESLLMYDIHGVTRVRAGQKIRCVPEIIDEIDHLNVECARLGLRLHGVHLETIGDNAQQQCVDEPDQLPLHPGNVDPQLNPRQLKRVLDTIQV